MKKRLNRLGMLEDSVCTTLMTSCNPKGIVTLSAIAESAAQSKEMICCDKLKNSNKFTRKQKSSKTSDRVLTLKEKECTPYWNDLCKEISSKLWCPTETVLRDSDMPSLSSLSKEMVGKSWFSTTMYQPVEKQSSLPTSWPFSTTPAVECTEQEVIRIKKIRIYPTKEQASLFRGWFGCSRFAYNETVNNLNLPKEDERRLSGGWMKISAQLIKLLPEWSKEIPFQIRKMAVRDAFNAFVNGCRKAKKTGELFKLSYRSRKNPKQSCFIPSTAIRGGGIYPTYSGKVKMMESIPDTCRDSRLVFDNGRWFLHTPYRVKVTSSDNQGRVVALDPGIRTFLTGFSSDAVFKVGAGDFSRIARLAHHCDDLISRMTKVNHAKRSRMKKALQRMKHKIWDLIDELHFKSINFLMKSFDCVVFPTFNSSEMVTKATRKIRSKTVRAILTFAFFRFSQRLEHKAKALGKTVIRISEAYTSKTASWTGEVKEKLGSSKFITSSGEKMDRDINGARGIFLRALGDTPCIA